MEEQSLAANGISPQRISPEMVKHVIELLKQGISPEELVQRGVPQKVVELAMAQLSQEVTAVPNEGLAGMYTNNINKG